MYNSVHVYKNVHAATTATKRCLNFVPSIQLNKQFRTKGVRVVTNCLRFLFVFSPSFSGYRRNCSTFPRLNRL